MTTLTNFGRAGAAFRMAAETDSGVCSKELLQKRLDDVAQAFNESDPAEQLAHAPAMVEITIIAADIGLQKPRLLPKNPAL
ncbi:MAG: hypothetical protein JWO78_2222 [Micavibrio sp.]|nr:hypothetical protein [Micavibrio sp.]